MFKPNFGVVVVGILLGAQIGLAAAGASDVPLGADAIMDNFEPPAHAIQYSAQQQSGQLELQLQQQVQQQQLQLQQEQLEAQQRELQLQPQLLRPQQFQLQ